MIHTLCLDQECSSCKGIKKAYKCFCSCTLYLLLLLLPIRSLQVISALHYLHTQLQVIHRDVKPSNILISRAGQVKMCDFGISGYLVDSVAKTIDAGCKPYMAVRTRQQAY